MLVDNDEKKGGDATHNPLDDGFFENLRQRVAKGEFFAIFAAPPCSTFSISRFYKKANAPPLVRDRFNIHGLPGVPAAHQKELADANALVARTCRLLSIGFNAGAQFILENPVDRGDRALPRAFLHENHGSIWQKFVALPTRCPPPSPPTRPRSSAFRASSAPSSIAPPRLAPTWPTRWGCFAGLWPSPRRSCTTPLSA